MPAKSLKPVEKNPGWFATGYNMFVKGGLLSWVFGALAADADIEGGNTNIFEKEVGASTMAAFGGLALGETGAAYGKAQKACATGVSTTERIKAVLGFTASGAAATGAIFVRNGPTTAAAAPYCFITAFGINAGIDLKNAQEKVQRGDKAGAAIDLSNAAANLYQTIGGVWGGIMHSKAGLMYAASVVSVAQALLDLARQLRTIPEQTIAGEERSLVDESGRGGKSPSPSHSDSGGE